MNTHSKPGRTAAMLAALMVVGLLSHAATAGKDTNLPKTIAICTDCKDETIGMISQEYLSLIDLAQFFAAIDTIPAWASGKAKLPVGDNPGCAELGLRFYEGVHAANLYRLYHSQLKGGSNLIRGDLAGTAKTYPPGSKEHHSAQEELYRQMNLSFATGQRLLDAYAQQSCYASEGVAK